MERAELLRRVKSILQDAFGPRLRGVILYGSEARGTAEPDSDIDLLVLLEGPVDYWAEVEKCIHVLYPLVLEFERPIDATPADAHDYEADRWPLYREVKREGILV
ncbi:MAG: nucleotidyltransferase domain-containing protein [Planctomycetes bacterium]|nr:nucleotidyltransferase domain-containing protein [Planctomycetota bacterium]